MKHAVLLKKSMIPLTSCAPSDVDFVLPNFINVK